MIKPNHFPAFDCIAFHDSCTDGAMAATIALVALDPKPTQVVACRYDDPLPPQLVRGGRLATDPTGTNSIPVSEGPKVGRLLCLDWCPTHAQLRHLMAEWDFVFVIDHHASREWLPQLFPDNCYFDAQYSGAMLAWKWFHGNTPPPPVVEYVQDRDLWQWRLPNSRAVSQVIWNNLGFQFLESLLVDFPLESMVRIGDQLLQQQSDEIAQLAGTCFPVKMRGQYVVLTNAPIHPSEVCELLLRRWSLVETVAAFRFLNAERVRLNIRSRTGKAQQLAEAYGGGGHPNSAGVTISAKEFYKILGRAVALEEAKS